MRILQLCKKFPYPLKDGESIAVNSLSKALCTLGCEMTLFAMNTQKHYSKVPQDSKDLAHYEEIHHVYVDNRLKPLDALSTLINGKSYHLSRFNNKLYREKLAKLLQENHFDIVQLETSYMSMFINTIKENSDAKIVLRSHNLEYEIWKRIASNSSTGLKSWYLGNCAEKLYDFELKNLPRYDLMVSITHKDLEKYKELGYKGMSIASPTGLELSKYQYKPLKKKQSIGFIGSLDWMPNVEGLAWFLSNAWPTILANNPELKFHIAGRNIGQNILQYKSDSVIIEGEVKCSKTFISEHNIMVVPLFSGSGIRIKILEGLALGRTVVSTTIGAEGLNIENGNHLLLADNKENFAEAIQYCLNSPEIMKEFSKNGRALIDEKYSNVNNARLLYQCYERLCSKTKTNKSSAKISVH